MPCGWSAPSAPQQSPSDWPQAGSREGAQAAAVPVFALRFQAPLTFHNCLPHALTLTLADSAGGADAATFAVPAGGSHAVYQFDLGRRLSMSIAMAARPAPSTARLALGPSKLSQHVGAAPATGLRTGVSSRGHEGAGRTGIAFCSALQHQRVLRRFTRGRDGPGARRSTARRARW